MTDVDRTQTAALISLLAALLGTIAALQYGLDAQGVALSAGLAYGVALTLAAPLQAPLGAVLATSIKFTGITLTFAVLVAVTGVHAGWQLLRGHSLARGVFA